MRRGVLDRGAAILHRVAAGGIAFIGGQLGVGGDDLQRRKGNVEFFGGDLLERGLETLAKLGLAGEHRDRAVGIDPYPGIEVGRRRKATRGFRRRCCNWCGLVLREGGGEKEDVNHRGLGMRLRSI